MKDIEIELYCDGWTVKVDGKSLYLSNCIVCHGEDGKKGYNGATNLTQTKLDHENIVKVIFYGKNSMMSFNETLNSAEMDAVADYITTLKILKTL